MRLRFAGQAHAATSIQCLRHVRPLWILSDSVKNLMESSQLVVVSSYLGKVETVKRSRQASQVNKNAERTTDIKKVKIV